MWPFTRKDQPAPVIAATKRSTGRPDYWKPYGNAQSYLTPPNDPNVMRVLRQAIPLMDAAVDTLVRLTGDASVVWESESVQAAWDAWADGLWVPPLTRGFNRWLNGLHERSLHYGTAVSEIVMDGPGREVYALTHISAATLKMRTDPSNPLDVQVLQQQSGAAQPVELPREFITILANEPEDKTPYGQPIWADCPFVGELLMEMVHAQKLDWIRLGAPSHAVLVGIPSDLDPSVDVQTLVGTMLDGIESDWSDAMTSRQTAGTVKDFFGAGDIEIVTVGADARMLDFQVPWRAALEQIVSTTHLPAWMLGMHWSTTERLSEEQAQSLEGIIRDYQGELEPHILWVTDWWARVRGYESVAREVDWPDLVIRDRVEMARAEVLGAQAQQTRQKIGRQLWVDGVFDQQRYADYVLDAVDTPLVEPLEEPAPAVDRPTGPGMALAAKNACDHDHAKAARVSYGGGETPASPKVADAIDRFYGAIIEAWARFRGQVWDIANLPSGQSAKDAGEFVFSPQQQAAFDEAVERFVAEMAGEDRDRLTFAAGDGLIQEWDVFGHEVGIGRAAAMAGAEAAVLTAGRNTENVQAMLSRAFDRLSEGGRLRLETQLEPIKQTLMDAAASAENPISVARTLEQQFTGYERYEWERLARTEIAFADNDGLLAEWGAEGIDTSGVQEDPPPWHPNCLCSMTIEKDADTGDWRAVYEVAATACDICQDYAT